MNDTESNPAAGDKYATSNIDGDIITYSVKTWQQEVYFRLANLDKTPIDVRLSRCVECGWVTVGRVI